MGQYEDREYSHLHCIPILSSVFCAVEFMRLPHSKYVAANILQENYNPKLQTYNLPSALPCRQKWARPSKLLTSFGTKALVDFCFFHILTYGAFFGFINISL